MYKQNTLSIGTENFSTIEELRHYLMKNVNINASLDELEAQLKKSSDQWDTYFLVEHLLCQKASPCNFLAPRTDGLALGYYGCNSESYKHWYFINDMLQGELLLAELNFIEAIKYSSYSMTAITAISGFYMEKLEGCSTHDALFLAYEQLLNSCPERKSINGSDLAQPFFQINKKPLFAIADAHANGGLRKSISSFLTNNYDFLLNWGLHKTLSSRYRIPIYESYLFYIMYCYWKRAITKEQLIEINNQYVAKFASNSFTKKIKCRTTLYHINQIFRLLKVNIIQKYYDHFISDKYLQKLTKSFSTINDPKGFIDRTFFNSNFVDKFIQSDWSDCYIFIKHILDYAIVVPEDISGDPIDYFESKVKKLSDFIETPLHSYIDEPLIAILKKDLLLLRSNLNGIESHILAQLDQNAYISEYYTDISNHSLTITDRILQRNFFQSEDFFDPFN